MRAAPQNKQRIDLKLTTGIFNFNFDRLTLFAFWTAVRGVRSKIVMAVLCKYIEQK